MHSSLLTRQKRPISIVVNTCEPIQCACVNGHREVVKWLAAQDGVSLTAEFIPRNLQPIHCACGNGHLELVKWLVVQHGVSLTAKAKEGSQPIHWACGDGQWSSGWRSRTGCL